MYKLQELGDDRFKIQELQKNGRWFTYNFAYIKGLEELISYVKHWLEHYPNNKYRIIDRYSNKVVYE
jgi:hypothetical protein